MRSYHFDSLVSEKTPQTIVSCMAKRLQDRDFLVSIDMAQQSLSLSETRYSTTVRFSRKTLKGKMTVNWIFWTLTKEYKLDYSVTPSRGKQVKIFENDINRIIQEVFIVSSESITGYRTE